MSKILAALGLIVLLSACASNPEVRWAQVQQAANDVTDYVLQGRQPCVDVVTYPGAGPEHPLCRVSDAEWQMFKALRMSLDEALRKADMADATENYASAAMYLKRAEAFLLDLQKMGARQ